MEHPSASMIRDMVERVIELTRGYAIWWTLVDKANFDRYGMTINRHEDFFATTTHALFQNITIITHQLFDKRSGTTSLVNLTRELATSNPALQCKLMKEIEACEPHLRKVRSIRSNVYAHRSKAKCPENIFAEERLTPAEMERIVLLSQRLVVALAISAGMEDITDIKDELKRREEYACEDTQLIMEALNQQFHG